MIKFEIAKRDSKIARLQLQRKDAELKLTTIEMNVKSSVQGLWTLGLKGQENDLNQKIMSTIKEKEQ